MAHPIEIQQERCVRLPVDVSFPPCPDTLRRLKAAGEALRRRGRDILHRRPKV